MHTKGESDTFKADSGLFGIIEFRLKAKSS